MSKLLVVAAAAALVLEACGRRNDSIHREMKSKDADSGIQSSTVSSTESSGQQSKTSSESAVQQAWASSSGLVGNAASSANLPSGLKLGGASGNSCYQDERAMAAGKAQLSDGSTISFVAASNGFKVWKDDASSKILKASGLFQGKDDWQKKLQPSGFGATSDYFTDFAGIAGRACPEMTVYLLTSQKILYGRLVRAT